MKTLREMKTLLVFLFVCSVVLLVLNFFTPTPEKPTAAQQDAWVAKKINQAPERSLIVMKDEKILLISRVADKPYSLDVLSTPGGGWQRIEFDEEKRKGVKNVVYDGPVYQTLAQEFLKQ